MIRTNHYHLPHVEQIRRELLRAKTDDEGVKVVLVWQGRAKDAAEVGYTDCYCLARPHTDALSQNTRRCSIWQEDRDRHERLALRAIVLERRKEYYIQCTIDFLV